LKIRVEPDQPRSGKKTPETDFGRFLAARPAGNKFRFEPAQLEFLGKYQVVPAQPRLGSGKKMPETDFGRFLAAGREIFSI